MKLIYCPDCEDVRKIHSKTLGVQCRCGKSWGYYEADGIHARYGGSAIPLGIGNGSFVLAVQEWMHNSKHPKAFVAFVIEGDCPTFERATEVSVVVRKKKTMQWIPSPRAGGRMEWECEHGIGHGNHVHGCDGCCSRDDYPGRGVKR